MTCLCVPGAWHWGLAPRGISVNMVEWRDEWRARWPCWDCPSPAHGVQRGWPDAVFQWIILSPFISMLSWHALFWEITTSAYKSWWKGTEAHCSCHLVLWPHLSSQVPHVAPCANKNKTKQGSFLWRCFIITYQKIFTINTQIYDDDSMGNTL